MVGKYPLSILYHTSPHGNSIRKILYYHMRAVAERETLAEKMDQNKLLSCLKLYPNKALGGRSKPIHFSNNQEFFEERCMLFIDYVYLLLQVEAEQRPAFLSQNIFINHLAEIYMFYSFDPSSQGRLAKVAPGGLLSGIIAAFHRLFAHQGEVIADSEHQTLYEKTVHCLLPYFDDLRQRSQKYYYQLQGEDNCNYQFSNQPSNPFSILVKLQGSELFREYSYPLKCSTALVGKAILDPAGKQLKDLYLQVWQNQQCMLRQSISLTQQSDISMCVSSHYLHLLRYMQLLQKEALVKLNISENDLLTAIDKSTTCTLLFQANLKRQSQANKTSNQKSSESSTHNVKELSKQEKQKLQREQEYLQGLAVFKGKIKFSAKIVHRPWGFEVYMEAISLWTIDEIYFYNLADFWSNFVNRWHNLAHHDEGIHQRIANMALHLQHRNKNIVLKTVLRVRKERSLLEQVIVGYDQVVMAMLLLQPILKKMYKMGYHFVNFSKKSFQELSQVAFLQNKMAKLGQALKRYSKYYSQLVSLTV